MLLRVAAKVGHQDTRSTNRRLVLQALVRSNGRSRADLARLTGLTPATVSALVADLFEEGLVEELGRGPAKVGKPSQLLGLNAGSRNIICVDLSDSSVLRAAVIDLSGEIIHRVEHPFVGVAGEAAVALTCDAVAEAVSAASAPLLGVGVGTPGVVAPEGIVVEASRLGWTGLDLAQRLWGSPDGTQQPQRNEQRVAEGGPRGTRTSTVRPTLSSGRRRCSRGRRCCRPAGLSRWCGFCGSVRKSCYNGPAIDPCLPLKFSPASTMAR